MKNQKGVTLVTLVVTIIVLIILAGISINLILGDNGIITIAKKAKENTELAKIQEETELNELYYQLETEGSNSENLPYDTMIKLTEFKTAIANAIEEAGGIKPDTPSETAVFANNIKGIVKEVTKNATATAEDIAQGKTAWVNGSKITGTASDFSKMNVYQYKINRVQQEYLTPITTTLSLELEPGKYFIQVYSSDYRHIGSNGKNLSDSTIESDYGKLEEVFYYDTTDARFMNMNIEIGESKKITFTFNITSTQDGHGETYTLFCIAYKL